MKQFAEIQSVNRNDNCPPWGDGTPYEECQNEDGQPVAECSMDCDECPLSKLPGNWGEANPYADGKNPFEAGA